MNYSEHLHRIGSVYREYMRSPAWQKKKEIVFLEKGYACERCGSTEDLHVHHASYRFLGEEPVGYLFVLCENCHCAFHKKYKINESMLRKTLNFVFGKGSSRKMEYQKKYNIF